MRYEAVCFRGRQRSAAKNVMRRIRLGNRRQDAVHCLDIQTLVTLLIRKCVHQTKYSGSLERRGRPVSLSLGPKDLLDCALRCSGNLTETLLKEFLLISVVRNRLNLPLGVKRVHGFPKLIPKSD